jgi:hypothetical protein
VIRFNSIKVAALIALTSLGSCSSDDGPRYATTFTLVTVDPSASAPLKLAVQACAGLKNRELGGSVYVQFGANESTWLSSLALSEASRVTEAEFIESCATEIGKCVHYDYEQQQVLLPSILTVASVLGAIPTDDELGLTCEDTVFDAEVTFADKNTPVLAARYVYENYAKRTTGLAMLNPGYDIYPEDNANPPIVQDMSPALVDFVFSKRLFVAFLVNGCSTDHPEHALLDEMVNAGNWPLPLGVYGYYDTWLVGGGFLYEAQTLCLESRNMGQIPTTTNNLSFFSTRRPPITKPGQLTTNEAEDITYDPQKTYVAFVVGDGDNVAYIMSTRRQWLTERMAHCEEVPDECAPLTWSISPHLPKLAPDVLEWYYASALRTGHDYFTLPPSGHLYAYPGSLTESAQNRFVSATEADARILGIHTTVDWEWFTSWRRTVTKFYPKYAKNNVIRGIIAVNVPYLVEAFPSWPEDQFYDIIDERVALFRPREWRGVDDSDDFHLSPANMADELANYPRGTVTAIYMTSDGGLSLENSYEALVSLLAPHVELVSTDTAARLALEASGH